LNAWETIQTPDQRAAEKLTADLVPFMVPTHRVDLVGKFIESLIQGL
jgi:hypothetical protein